ncbi:Hypothetical predicted protein [Octopus vulgaris]|uniref:Uncharacterized protein n=1 Tax=Octopus vulgaris TaxID=6645 RepID=A0AA36BEH1_OCTVU|nr:Hypothetical predicted protein [Octopus vulgaris]
MTSNPKSRGINAKQNPIDRLTEILIRKQLEQVDKVQQKNCSTEITGRKVNNKPTLGCRNNQTSKSYSRLLGGSSIYFIDENNKNEHLKVALSNDFKMYNMKMNYGGDMERLKTNIISANDSRKVTEFRRTSKNLIKRRYHDKNLQRNMTFINSSSLPKDDTTLTGDLKVTKVNLVRSRTELQMKGTDDNYNNSTNNNSSNNNINSISSNNNINSINSNSFSQPSCGGVKTSIKQSPRLQNHCLRSKVLGNLQLPRKTTSFNPKLERKFPVTNQRKMAKRLSTLLKTSHLKLLCFQ